MANVYKLSDYKVLDFFVRHVDLELDLTKEAPQSKALLTIEPNPEFSPHPTDLQLDCQNMQLTSVLLNGRLLSTEEYELKDNSLIIKNVPHGLEFTVETTATLGKNTDLFGYYTTEGTGLVKAETEGLRRVFPCKDRPDNLATYKTTLIANKKEFPTLLANGLAIEEKNSDKIHSVTWVNPIPIPSYLFAMVAGNLICSKTSYITNLGREIPVEFYIPEGAVAKCVFAQEVLKAAMAWDEQRFNLECPLPAVKVAGVNKYASGASEPLGLILFNTANLYATAASRTDIDIIRVMDVVAHEFFHTWTGDLVTIRDWFNLAAKEGLTTFRTSLFLEYILGIDPERMFYGHSLDERAPRPDSYTAVRSLYTSAAYEKSAEIFRMIMSFMGEEAFNKGLTAFLQQHAGEAITLENILNFLSNKDSDVNQFLPWFTESGIPKVTVTDEYDEVKQIYKLKFATHGAEGRPIPVDYVLFDKNGIAMFPNQQIIIDQPEMIIDFPLLSERPTPSLLRGFSAPIHLEFAYTNQQLLFLIHYDDDVYNRCNAAKTVIRRLVSEYCAGKSIELSSEFSTTYRTLLMDNKQKTWVLAELLALPSEEDLIASFPNASFEKVVEGRRLIQEKLAQELKSALHSTIKELDIPSKTEDKVLFDFAAAGNRRLKAVCYSYLCVTEPEKTELALINQFQDALGKNMTDTISALALLANANSSQSDKLLEQFYQYWQHDPDAINYWFNLQAAAHLPTVVDKVRKLIQHPAFDLSNPNKIYALLGVFIKNIYGFHALSGEGYKLVADIILQLEKINPTLAANLTEKFSSWDKFDKQRQNLMRNNLKYIYEQATTPEVRNMAGKGLGE